MPYGEINYKNVFKKWKSKNQIIYTYFFQGFFLLLWFEKTKLNKQEKK